MSQIPDVMDLLRTLSGNRRGVTTETLERVVVLSVEIAREGREGHKVGTMFVVGDAEETLSRSKCLILDPLQGYEDTRKHINNPDMWETLKELAQLDGAFIVSDDGVVLSACRYINATSTELHLPLGLGSRHVAAASITRETRAIAAVVSESSVVRIFDGGEIIAEIIPELWLLGRHELHLHGSHPAPMGPEVTAVRRDE